MSELEKRIQEMERTGVAFLHLMGKAKYVLEFMNIMATTISMTWYEQGLKDSMEARKN